MTTTVSYRIQLCIHIIQQFSIRLKFLAVEILSTSTHHQIFYEYLSPKLKIFEHSKHFKNDEGLRIFTLYLLWSKRLSIVENIFT